MVYFDKPCLINALYCWIPLYAPIDKILLGAGGACAVTTSCAFWHGSFRVKSVKSIVTVAFGKKWEAVPEMPIA